MFRVTSESEVHRYAVPDEAETASYTGCTDTALKEFVSKVDAVLAGGYIVLFPESQWDVMIDSHRSKSRFSTRSMLLLSDQSQST
jgi:hypothetical protein